MAIQISFRIFHDNKENQYSEGTGIPYNQKIIIKKLYNGAGKPDEHPENDSKGSAGIYFLSKANGRK